MQQPMPHQLMGYDRAITMFSPDGRLLQVEYARKTVRQGSTAIGVSCKDGVLLVADKRIVDKLIIPESVEKIFEVDSHILATGSGIMSDAHVLIERARVKAQQHRITFDNPVDVLSVVKDIASLNQITTQSAGWRPFGVSIIVAGIDNDGPKVFEIDPTGIYFQYKATVIGEAEPEIEEILNNSFSDNLSITDALSLCLDALKKVLGKNFSIDRIDAAYLGSSDSGIVRLSKSEVEAASKGKLVRKGVK